MSIKSLKTIFIFCILFLSFYVNINAQENLAYLTSYKLTDSKILAAGKSEASAIITKYLTNGKVDVLFGDKGNFLLNKENNSMVISYLNTTNDGKILAVGYIQDNITKRKKQLIVRVLADGKIDQSFGNNGYIITQFSNTSDETLNSLIVNKDNSFFAGGTTNFIGNYKGTIAKYHANGKLDSTFGVFGFVYVFIQEYSDDGIIDLNIQSDGQLIATIISNENGTSYLMHKRFFSSGLLDRNINSGANYFWQLKKTEECPSKPFISNDGNLIVGGKDWNILHENLVVRLDEDPNNLYSFNGNSYIVDPLNSNSKLKLFYHVENIEEIKNILLSKYSTDGAIYFNQQIGENYLLSPNSLCNNVNSIKYIPELKAIIGELTPTINANPNYTCVRTIDKLMVGNEQIKLGYNNIIVCTSPISNEHLFEYKLDYKTNVSLKLYDEKGKQIQVIIDNTNKEIGDYKEKIIFPKDSKNGLYYLEYMTRYGNVLIQIHKI